MCILLNYRGAYHVVINVSCRDVTRLLERIYCHCLAPLSLPVSLAHPSLIVTAHTKTGNANNSSNTEVVTRTNADSSPDPEEILVTEDAPSDEMQQLCKLQLELMIKTIRLSLLSAPTTDTTTTTNNNDDDNDDIEDRVAKANAFISCTAYRRVPSSLANAKLQLQFIASTDEGTASNSETRKRREDLFLGVQGPTITEQETWILSQGIIVLPDSGGLVLPCSYNGQFLVGMMVIERCDATTYMGSSATCNLFGSEELRILQQGADVLSLICTIDLRSSLERASHAYRSLKVAGLIGEAKKPLTTLRTLGAMLAPRLEQGEPERDMAEALLAQGESLARVVGQLQAALHPGAGSGMMTGSGGGGGGGGSASSSLLSPPSRLSATTGIVVDSSKQLPASSSLSRSATGSTGTTIKRRKKSSKQRPYSVPYPALPSSSIGSDNWGEMARYSSTDEDDFGYGDVDVDVAYDTAQQQQMEGEEESVGVTPVKIPGTPLIPVLRPLLTSAANFAAVNGIAFSLPPLPNATEKDEEKGDECSNSTFCWASQKVAVESSSLKRILSRFLDFLLNIANSKGDCLEASLSLLNNQTSALSSSSSSNRSSSNGAALSVALSVAVMWESQRDNRVVVGMDGDGDFAALQVAAQNIGGGVSVQVLDLMSMSITLLLPAK